MTIKEERVKRKTASGKDRKVHTRACSKCKNDTPLTLLDQNVCVYCRAGDISEELEKTAEEENAQRASDRRLAREKAKRQEMYRQSQAAQRERTEREAARKAKQEVVFDKQEEARKELARRQLAKDHLLPLVMRVNPDYQAGWVHKDICEHLEWFSNAVAAGQSPRLIIAMPPRSGKSELASRIFPAWHLGRNPAHEIIACSYAGSLANDFSRKVRGLLRDASYQSVFPDVSLAKDSQSVEVWNTNHAGGYVAAGVGGPITGRGAHCLPLTANVLTPEGPRSMEWLINNSHELLTVLSYDGTRVVERPINAILTRTANGFYRVQTSTGTIEATGSHPLCVGFDGARPLYRRVDDLRAGDKLFAVEGATGARGKPLRAMSDVRHGVHAGFGQVQEGREAVRGANTHVQQPMLGAASVGRHIGGAFVRHMRAVLSRMGVRRREETQTGGRASLLLQRVLRGLSLQNLCRGESPSVLCGGAELPSVRKPVLPKRIRDEGQSHKEPVLRPGMLCRVATWSAYPEEFEDSRGAILSTRVQTPPGSRDGDKPRMCRVWEAGGGFTPQGREPREQRSGQLGIGLSVLSHEAPPIRTDCCVESIEWVPGDLTVADLEVEGTNSFLLFNGTLSRNCLIVDDPLKNRDDAESEGTRQSIWDWYTSTAYTRLAPGGGVIVMATRWHDADLTGRLLQQMEDGEGDEWKVVKYPAIAEHDELFRMQGAALHPERYPVDALERIKRTIGPRDWSALYQQNPVADDGDYFKKEDFQWYKQQDLPPLEEMNFYTAWDLAIGQKEQNDFTVGITVGVDRQDNIYVVDIQRGRWRTLEIIEKMLEVQRVWQSKIVGIERGHILMTMGPILEKRIRETRTMMPVEELKPGRQDKIARARPIQARMQQKRVFFRQHCDATLALYAEMMRFPNGAHDDGVDSMAWIGQLLTRFTSTREKKQPPKRSWRDKLSKTIRTANTRSAMTS